MEKRHPNHPGDFSTDARITEASRDKGEINARARAIEILMDAGVPFVVGGAYAYATYTGIYRDTKDLDLFPRKRDALRALEILEKDGWRTERTDEVWLYKGFKGEWFVDLIFSSGNGVAVVDDEWFEYAKTGEVFGRECLIAPAEEIIWSKAFVVERERYDGADVNHLIKCVGRHLDWNRILRRFDRYWEVLLSHVMMYRFAYPGERSNVPDWVMVDLLSRALESVKRGDWKEGEWPWRICRGNLISKVNYTIDIRDWGYDDGRKWDEVERAKDNTGREAQNRGAGSELEAASSGGR